MADSQKGTGRRIHTALASLGYTSGGQKQNPGGVHSERRGRGILVSAKAFSVEVTGRTVTFTFFAPVPGADYLQPAGRFRIPLKCWRDVQELQVGQSAFCNFTPAQLKAHGALPVSPGAKAANALRMERG